MKHQRHAIIVFIILLFTVSSFGAFFFWKSFEDWRDTSPLKIGPREGFSWATGQYVVELERSRNALLMLAAGQTNLEDVQTRLAILQSRGDILVEPSPLANSMNTDKWTRAATQELAAVTARLAGMGEQLGNREAAMNAAKQLAAMSPLAYELNVRMHQRDNLLVSSMIDAQQNLQTGFGIAATVAMVCAIVLAIITFRQLDVQRRLNDALRQAEQYARRSAETERRASASMRRIVNELMTVERAREGRLSLDATGIDIDQFLVTALPGCEVSPRLVGARACLDTGLVEMALGSLWAISRSRGQQHITATRSADGMVIDIEDDGPPIGNTDGLFQPLSVASLSAGDSGVGHAAARLVAEAHGGAVAYEYTGERNRYRITLPLRGCA